MEVKDWKEPSGRRTSSSTAQAVADALSERTGQWAVIEEIPTPGDEAGAKKARAKLSNRASLIKQGRLKPFQPKGTFDAASRSEVNDEGENVIRVYAQHVGPEGAEKAAAKDAEKAKAKAAANGNGGGGDGPAPSPPIDASSGEVAESVPGPSGADAVATQPA